MRIFNHFTLSCFNYVKRISLASRSLIPQENLSKKSTLEYKLDCDENLTRASRSNTGTRMRLPTPYDPFTITLLHRVVSWMWVRMVWSADLLASERDADVVALTVSQAQSFYCRSRGHKSVHADAETLNLADTFGYDSFDVSFMLESLEHISNKRDLLSRLRDVSSKL